MHTFIQLILMLGMFGLISKSTGNVLPKLKHSSQQPTVIYFIRHAEKLTTGGNDPDLSAVGRERAIALKEYFEGKPVEGLFASPYKRTHQTLEPLAQARNLTIREYSTRNYESLPGIIAAEFTGKTVIIAGHTNTLLETIEAFKVKRPVTEIAENKYDHLFKLTLQKGKAPKMEMLRYGK